MIRSLFQLNFKLDRNQLKECLADENNILMKNKYDQEKCFSIAMELYSQKLQVKLNEKGKNN